MDSGPVARGRRVSSRATPADHCGAAVLLQCSLADDRIDAGQAWFWNLDWLSGELEADREAPSDPGAIYDDAESFKAALHAAQSE
jgi:hypothetical protein